MKYVLRPLPFALAILIAACAGAPVPESGSGPPRAEAPRAQLSGVSETQPVELQPAVVRTNVWQRLRGSFAMTDCAADPGIDAWARRYTRSPKHFEAQMQRILPRLVYVQESASRHGVPGEFALLPWVESHFKPVAPHKNRAAGMWQIMPDTARHMGLTVERDYDARLDLTASTDKVMALLSHYHDYFQDWRLADYAYNAGRFGIDRLVNREGAPSADPAVPALPVRASTRAHLVKLMAIACVIQQPERFHVTLPTLAVDDQLVAVEVNQPVALKKLASEAGLPLAALADLNAGYRDGVVDTRHGGRVLLPRGQAEQLRNGMLAGAVGEPAGRVAGIGDGPALPALDEQATATADVEHIPGATAPTASQAPAVHIVRRGETLYELAHRYRVQVAQLKHWNRLRGSAIQVGQKLKVSAPD